MKKMLTVIICMTLSCSAAFAASILVSKHNLSTSGTGVHSTTQTQICIFCHTPHSMMGGALWNRLPPDIDPSTYTLYNTSGTLTPAAKEGRIDSTSSSMLCMSCHGGTLEDIGAHVINAAGNPMTMVDTNGTWTESGVLWDGTSPVNHPIGFSYSLAQSQDPTRLYPFDQVNAALNGAFFTSSATGTTYQDSMECLTCHLVHDPANGSFLRIANTGNALCLTCHITTEHPIPVETKSCVNCHNPHGPITRGARKTPPPPFSNIPTSDTGTLKFTLTTTDQATGATIAVPRAYTYLRSSVKPPPMERFFSRADYIFPPGSADDGSYVISGVPAGTYYVRINQREDASQQTFDGALGPPRIGDLTWMQTSTITISTGQTLDLGALGAYPFSSAPITVTGIVRNQSGIPLAGYYVRAQKEPCISEGWNDSINQCGPVKNLALQPTDTEGRYTILLRDPGAYYIYASPCISAEYRDYTGNVCGYTAAAVNPVALRLRDTKTVDLKVWVY